MYFEQFYLGCLSHASYMLGSEGKAVVVDPQRDVEIYLKAADERGLKIAHIFETHLHADFVSGHIELGGTHRSHNSHQRKSCSYFPARGNAGWH